MRRIFAEAGRAVIRDVEPPEPRPGEVLVRTAFSTVSAGTELLILGKSAEPDAEDEEYPGAAPWVDPAFRAGIPLPLRPRRPLPGLISLGYSLAGTVIAVGDGVTDLVPGDRVACSGSQCAHHAEVVAVPRNLTARVPDGVPLEDASFVTLGAIAEEAIRRTAVTFGETIVLYGLGLLGLLAGQIAAAAGIYTIGLDLDPRRLALARELGIADVHDPSAIDVLSVVRDRTHGFGADAVILGVVTPSSEPLSLALRMARQHARVVGLGVFGMHLERDLLGDHAVVRSIAYGPGRYDPAYEENNVDYPIGIVRWTENRNAQHVLRLMAERRLVTAPLARRFALQDAPAGYELLRSPERPPTIQIVYGD